MVVRPCSLKNGLGKVDRSKVHTTELVGKHLESRTLLLFRSLRPLRWLELSRASRHVETTIPQTKNEKDEYDTTRIHPQLSNDGP